MIEKLGFSGRHVAIFIEYLGTLFQGHMPALSMNSQKSQTTKNI